MRAMAHGAEPQLLEEPQSAADAALYKLISGSRSGPAYVEEGSTILHAGVLDYEVPFTYQKATREYRFAYHYTEDTADPPRDVRVAFPEAGRTILKFSARLTGDPREGSILRWKVVAPDALVDPNPSPTGPIYVLDEPTTVDSRKYGLVGDGTTDNNFNLVSAAMLAAERHQQLVLTKGVYLVDGSATLNLINDLYIHAEPGAVIKGTGNGNEIIVLDGIAVEPRPKVYFTGFGTIDNSLRANVPNESSGTALTMVRLSKFFCDSWTFESAPGMGDSGISAVRVEEFIVRACDFLYQSDCGIYLSGNTDDQPTLDRNAIIDGCTFKWCGTGTASKRRYRNLRFINNQVAECGFGFVLWESGPGALIPAGRDAIVLGNNFDKCENLAIEFRSSLFGGIISDNTITDWGWSPTSAPLVPGSTYLIAAYSSGDSFTNVGAGSNATGTIFVATGTTPTTWSHGTEVRLLSDYPAAVFLSGCRNVKVRGNTIAMKEWAQGSNHFGVWLRDWSLDEAGGTVNYVSRKNRVEGNTFRNLQTGVVSGQATLGSDLGRNTFDNVTQRYDPNALDSILDDEGITYNPTATPQFGAFGSVITTGKYQRNGRDIRFRFSVHIITNGTGGTPTPGGIYVSLPPDFPAKDVHMAPRGVDTYYPKVLAGILTDTTTMYFKNGDGTYPGHDDAVLDGEIYYELA
jgi:hypothetical protein